MRQQWGRGTTPQVFKILGHRLISSPLPLIRLLCPSHIAKLDLPGSSNSTLAKWASCLLRQPVAQTVTNLHMLLVVRYVGRIDVLMFVSGDATVSPGSLAQLGVTLGMNAATVMLGGIGSGSTPYLMSNATVINGNGQALYTNNEIVTLIGKRDFSDADHRKKFAVDIVETVAKNLFR